MKDSINNLLEAIFKNWWLALIIGIITLFFSVIDFNKNYKKSSPTGKSAIIGFIGLGLIFLIISIIQLSKVKF